MDLNQQVSLMAATLISGLPDEPTEANLNWAVVTSVKIIRLVNKTINTAEAT